MSAEGYYFVDVGQSKALVRYVTLLPPKASFQSGVPREAFIGYLLRPDDALSPGNFVQNRLFVDVMQGIIDREGGQVADLQQRAAMLKDGKLPLFDDRLPLGSRAGAATEDVIGVFAVKDGRIVSYSPNRQHRLVSSKGLFRLPFGLSSNLLRELERRAAESPKKSR